MKLKTILVEDETRSREILRNYIAKYCPNIELVGEASGIEEGLNLIKNNELDLVFLDVEMPYGNAFDLLDKVENRTFETIFVTAYDHYAVEALNNQASYYLLKPISIDDLITAVDVVTDIKEKETALVETVLSPKSEIVSGKITVPQQDGFEVLKTSEILFCKADDNYTEIHMKSGKILASKTLKYFEEALQEFGFSRIHKSYVVNVNSIVKYKKGKGGSVVLENDKELQVAPSRKAALLNYFK
ncbi:MAG: response regulator transcription factor [Flavobacteriaceae bacterium]|nr:response regulator transcription factor [Flavobacteriaceae bacterium]